MADNSDDSDDGLVIAVAATAQTAASKGSTPPPPDTASAAATGAPGAAAPQTPKQPGPAAKKAAAKASQAQAQAQAKPPLVLRLPKPSPSPTKGTTSSGSGAAGSGAMAAGSPSPVRTEAGSEVQTPTAAQHASNKRKLDVVGLGPPPEALAMVAFQREERTRIYEESPTIDERIVADMILKRWAALPPAEKLKYRDYNHALDRKAKQPKRQHHKAPSVSERGEFKLETGVTAMISGNMAFRLLPVKMPRL